MSELVCKCVCEGVEVSQQAIKAESAFNVGLVVLLIFLLFALGAILWHKLMNKKDEDEDEDEDNYY
jgi:hypothetical protein